MFSLILSGGWLMLPIIFCSVLALAIVCERLWSLQKKRVLPPNLSHDLLKQLQNHDLNREALDQVARRSPLGRILSQAIRLMPSDKQTLIVNLESIGRHISHELERNLNLLGIIAAISPLLGLLGTVVGMIKIFTAITLQGVGNANALAGGISEALLTTAAGLIVAIPAMIAHRGFIRKIDDLLVSMEQEATFFINHLVKEPAKSKQAQTV